MRILIALLLATLASTAALHAEVVRAMPDFSWIDSTGKTKSSKDLRGRPLVILIADSPTEWAFRSQVGQLQKIYQRFAADGLVCIAAFSREPGLIRSNIPFLTVDGSNPVVDVNERRNVYDLGPAGLTPTDWADDERPQETALDLLV